jgi:hypothetical protein
MIQINPTATGNQGSVFETLTTTIFTVRYAHFSYYITAFVVQDVNKKRVDVDCCLTIPVRYFAEESNSLY